jgi:hypothetical protein
MHLPASSPVAVRSVLPVRSPYLSGSTTFIRARPPTAAGLARIVPVRMTSWLLLSGGRCACRRAFHSRTREGTSRVPIFVRDSRSCSHSAPQVGRASQAVPIPLPVPRVGASGRVPCGLHAFGELCSSRGFDPRTCDARSTWGAERVCVGLWFAVPYRRAASRALPPRGAMSLRATTYHAPVVDATTKRGFLGILSEARNGPRSRRRWDPLRRRWRRRRHVLAPGRLTHRGRNLQRPLRLSDLTHRHHPPSRTPHATPRAPRA